MPTVIVPTNYATIQAAVNAVYLEASESDPGVVNILEGEYEEPGNYGLGLYIRNFVRLVGESRDGVIIYPPTGIAGADAVIYPGRNVMHENLTLYAREDNHYALHQDHLSDWITWKNCVFYHEDAGKAAIGAGARAGQVVTLQDVTITQGTFSIHSDVYSRAVTPSIWRWILDNVTAAELVLVDYVEYKLNAIALSGCTIGEISWSQLLTYYDLYPSDPPFNQGFVQYGMQLYDRGGNDITTLTDITWTPAPNSRSGQKLVSSAGSAERLHIGFLAGCSLMVTALPGNTGLVYLGNDAGDVSSASGMPLAAGQSLRFSYAGNLRQLFLDAAVDGDGIAWLLLS